MQKKVLICPLNWGLGHATRCIPVIAELEKCGCEVLIGGDGESLALLRIEFPDKKFFEITPYGITYSANSSFMLHLASQTPRLLAAIKEEHEQILTIVEKEKVDFIISDNRYGCYSENIPSAIIIHQLSIRAPLFFKKIINRYNANFIERFTQCWVPDTPDRSLSGELSKSKSIKHKFIGPLSRMTPNGTSATSFRLLGLVSGPEPNRSSFETLLTRELAASDLSYRIVRGLPDEKSAPPPNSVNHLPSKELNELIASADVVIGRSGYSTIMDLAALKKKAIFVPTPGQTEQLYLAKEMERMKIAPTMLQNEMQLTESLERLKDFTGFTQDYFKNDLLQTTLREFLG